MAKLSNSFESLKVIRIVMCFVGGLPPNILTYNHTKWEKLYLIYSLLLITVSGGIFVLSAFINLFSISDIEVLADSSYIMLEQVAFCVKACIVLTKWKQIRTIFEKLQSPELNSHSLDQDYIIQRSMWIVKRNFIIYICFVNSAVAVTFNAPLASGSKSLILQGWLPFDAINSTTNFVLTYAWQEIGTFMTANFTASMDMLATCLMVLICGQLNVLSNSLTNVRKNALKRIKNNEIYFTNCTNMKTSKINDTKFEVSDDILEEAIYQQIIRCVRYHYAILNLVEMVKDTFHNIIFAQIAGSVLIICVTTFEINLVSKNNPVLIGLVIYQMTMLQQVFLFCWYGNEIYYTSLNLFNATYMSEWNRSGKKVRQAIAIILDRTKYPILLKAGYFVPLTMETFIAILRLSYSFYTLLERSKS